MLPHVTLSPDLSQLDRKIAPLVRAINKIGIPTYSSCEGHGENTNIVQSPYPMVVICPGVSKDGAYKMLRFMGMLSMHNANSDHSDGVRWSVVPEGNMSFAVVPSYIHRSLEIYHRGIITLTDNFRKMMRWYDPVKKRRMSSG